MEKSIAQLRRDKARALAKKTKFTGLKEIFHEYIWGCIVKEYHKDCGGNFMLYSICDANDVGSNKNGNIVFICNKCGDGLTTDTQKPNVSMSSPEYYLSK